MVTTMGQHILHTPAASALMLRICLKSGAVILSVTAAFIAAPALRGFEKFACCLCKLTAGCVETAPLLKAVPLPFCFCPERSPEAYKHRSISVFMPGEEDLDSAPTTREHADVAAHISGSAQNDNICTLSRVYD